MRGNGLAVASIILVTAVAFLPVLGAEFVSWDDNRNFVGNPHYRGLGLAQLEWMWTTTLMGHYIPVSWMTLGLDYLLWGMDPRGYHLTNLVLHCAAAVLLYFVALRLFAMAPGSDVARVRLPAAAGALFFAVHPLRVESVAWITERRDMLSLVLLLATTLLYLRAVRGPTLDRRYYLLALITFALAVLAKAAVVTLPVVLAVINVMPLRRLPGSRKVFRELIPFFAISVVAGLLSLRVLDPPTQLGLARKIAVTAFSLRFYIEKIFIPAGLSPLYEMPQAIDPLAWRYVASYIVIIAAVATAWRFRHRSPAATAIMVASAVIMLPFLGLVQNGPQIAADRYTYHAGAAFSLLAALALIRWRNRALLAGTATILLVLGGLTWRQSTHWIDSERLWSRALDVDSTSAIAHFAMADLRMAQDDHRRAREHYARGVALDPLYPEGHNNLGSLLMREGQTRAAIAAFRQAIALRADYPEAHLNLGAALSAAGNPEQALAEFRTALSLRPDLPNAHFSWGNALVRLGRFHEAAIEYGAELALYPDHERARDYREQAVRQIRGERDSPASHAHSSAGGPATSSTRARRAGRAPP